MGMTNDNRRCFVKKNVFKLPKNSICIYVILLQFHQTGPSSLSTLNLNANVNAKMSEVIQSEIVGHGNLYLCAVFLAVHDKLTCEVSSTWTK